MNICVVGTGYVGLVTGACLADFGMAVVCVDKDEAKIAALQSGHIPIYEPGLEEIVAKNERAGRLTFTTDLKSSIERAMLWNRSCRAAAFASLRLRSSSTPLISIISPSKAG